jgi:hypothetical protein
MSVVDTRLFELIDIYVERLESSQDDVRRRGTDELYESIIAQYADVSFSSFFFKTFLFCLGTNRCCSIRSGEIARVR